MIDRTGRGAPDAATVGAGEFATAAVAGRQSAHTAFAATPEREGVWLDPRTKVAMLVGMNVVLICTPFDTLGYILKTLMAAITFFFLMNANRSKAAIVFAALFAAAACLQLFSDAVLFSVVQSTSIVALTARFLAMMMLQFVPGTLFAYSMLTGTKVSEFVAAMERMHLTQKIVIPFAVIFRFFPTVAEEYRSIRDAMRLRGVGWRSGPLAMLEYRLVPLIVSVVKIGDDLSAASMTRGLGGSAERTNACRIGFGAADALFGGIVLACVCITVASRVMGGW